MSLGYPHKRKRRPRASGGVSHRVIDLLRRGREQNLGEGLASSARR